MYLAPMSHVLRYGQHTYRTDHMAEPSSRFWRVRQAMRQHIADHVSSYVAPHLIDALYSLPGVWTEAQYADRMDTIRTMGIDAFRRGDICESGTNDFFEAFGMDAFEPECGDNDYRCESDDCRQCHPSTSKTVTVTVEITFTVDNDASEYNTESDVERYLSVDVNTNQVDDADNVDYTITSVSVELDEDY